VSRFANVAVDFLVEPVVAQHDVQALVPRDFIQNQRYRPLNRGSSTMLKSADFVNEAEEVLQVYILQVHGNRVSVYFLAGADALPAGCCGILPVDFVVRGSRPHLQARECQLLSGSDGGRGICGTLGDARFCFTGFRAAGSAAGRRAAAAGTKEIANSDPFACTL